MSRKPKDARRFLKPLILFACQAACVSLYGAQAIAQSTQPSGAIDQNGVVSISLLLAAIGFTAWIVWWWTSDRNETHKTIAQLKTWQDTHDAYCERRNRSLRIMHRKLNKSLGLPEDEGEELF